MDIHSYDTSNHVVRMCVLGWRSQQKNLVRKLTKMQRLACQIISLAFPVTPTSALEILLNITPIEEFFLAEAERGSYRITVSGLWHVNRIGFFGKTKSYVDVCNEARRFLPAERIKKTKVFERNFECQIMEKKNAMRSESVLNQNTVKVYTDGSKLDGWVGAGFYAEYPNNYSKQAFFHLGIYSTVFQFNLNQVGKQNHVSIAWIPGYAGVRGNEAADYLAKLDLNQNYLVLNFLL